MTMTLMAGVCLWVFTAAAVGPHGDRPARAPVLSKDVEELDLETAIHRPLTASDLAEELGVYTGKVVRVRSQVSRSFGRHAFVLNDEPLLAAPNVLVLVPDPLSSAALDYMMTVVGAPRPFNARELEEEYPWFRPELFREGRLWPNWERYGVPVLIAQSVRTESDQELVRTARSKFAVLPMVSPTRRWPGERVSTNEPITSLGPIWRSEDSTALAGYPVVLRAVRVERVIDPELIVVGTDPLHHIVVRLPTPTQSVIADDAVAISGVLARTPESWPPMGLGPWQPVYIDAAHVDLLNR